MIPGRWSPPGVPAGVSHVKMARGRVAFLSMVRPRGRGRLVLLAEDALLDHFEVLGRGGFLGLCRGDQAEGAEGGEQCAQTEQAEALPCGGGGGGEM